MSQKKVDAYKQNKANRSKIIRKEKTMLMIEKITALVLCIAAVCWIGFSVYTKAVGSSDTADEATVQETVMDTSALEDYLSGLTAQAE